MQSLASLLSLPPAARQFAQEIDAKTTPYVRTWLVNARIIPHLLDLSNTYTKATHSNWQLYLLVTYMTACTYYTTEYGTNNIAL